LLRIPKHDYRFVTTSPNLTTIADARLFNFEATSSHLISPKVGGCLGFETDEMNSLIDERRIEVLNTNLRPSQFRE